MAGEVKHAMASIPLIWPTLPINSELELEKRCALV